jgi:hypothetical protein
VRRIAGLAGLGYVAGVSIENMEVLEAPTLGSSVADIRASYADQAFAVVTSFAGALALVFYALFVAALFVLLRGDDRQTSVWAVAMLLGGIGGPVLAGMGLAASSVLVADGGTGLSDDVTETLSDLYLAGRMLSGAFVSLFLVGTGIAALQSRALPRALAWLALGVGTAVLLAPLAAFTGDHTIGVAATIAFSLQTLWVFLLSMWLALAEDGPPVALFVRRAAFTLLVVAAGLVGIGLIAAPGATETFFAWGLGPEALAAFAGGVYVGAAATYAAGLFQPWRRIQGLVAGAVVLSVSVLIVTLVHLEEFDFDRLQAWMWVVLFTTFSLTMMALLLAGNGDGAAPARRPLPAWARATLAAVAALLGVLALALWISPTGLSDASPFDLSPLGGGFAGSWVALLATLAGWAAAHNDAEAALLPTLGLVLLPAGGLVAALRTLPDLEPTGTALVYIAALVLLTALGAALLRALARESSSTIASSSSAARS